MMISLFVAVLAAIPLPATPVGQKLDAWLAALDGADEAKLRAFHEGDQNADEHIAKDKDLAQRTGGLDVVKIERATDTEIEVTLKARATQRLLRLSFGVEATPPHRVAMIGLRPAAAAEDEGQPPGKKLGDAEIAKELDAAVSKLAKDGRFSGAVRATHDGKTVYEKAFGLASRAWNAPNRVDTKLNLGSMNKMFTAVAVLQLVEQGKLGLDDTVGKLLPDFPNAEVRDKVTVRHLLTHTSGLGSFFDDGFEEKKLTLRDVRDYLPLIAREKLAFVPGARWSYSNSGFVLLGAIIEKVSGTSYDDHVRKHVYAPAGMKDTDCYELDRDVPNLATGYTRGKDGAPRSNVFLHVVRGGPAGGGYSTVGDLVRFAAALQSGKLLSPAMVKELTTGKVDAPFGKYAFGFGDSSFRGHRIVGHNGGFAGISANLDIFLDDGWTVAVLANVDEGAIPVMQKARDLIAR